MATHRAPKQWSLTKVETVNSFENWKENLKYVLSLDPSFAPFLMSGFTWDKKTRAAPNRGFTNDPETVDEAVRKTAAQKVTHLELMLGQIANYCPVISRNTLLKILRRLNQFSKLYERTMAFNPAEPTSLTWPTSSLNTVNDQKTYSNGSWPLLRTIYLPQEEEFPITVTNPQRKKN